MKVSVRLQDELVDEIDRVAAANGQTRSSWIALALARAAVARQNDALPLPSKGGGGPADEQTRVTVRLSRTEIEAITAVGAPMGLNRNEWIKRTIRWQLWDKAGRLRLAPATGSELGKLRKQVIAIGRNINQAVHAMNAANQPESRLEVHRIAEPFLETCAELRSQLTAMRRALATCMGGDVAYWTEAFTQVRR